MEQTMGLPIDFPRFSCNHVPLRDRFARLPFENPPSMYMANLQIDVARNNRDAWFVVPVGDN